MTAEEVVLLMDRKHALFGLFFAFHNRLQAAGDAFYEEITCKQFFLLACMNLYPDDAPTSNELAKTMGCSRQSVKEILNSLEGKGFIKLCVDKNDKRKRRIYLTEKALHLSEIYHDKENAFMEHLFKGVKEEEINIVYKILSHIENNLKEMKKET